jgi:hypothetical protein
METFPLELDNAYYFLGHALNDILDKNIFGNSDIKFNRNPLFSNRF